MVHKLRIFAYLSGLKGTQIKAAGLPFIVAVLLYAFALQPILVRACPAAMGVSPICSDPAKNDRRVPQDRSCCILDCCLVAADHVLPRVVLNVIKDPLRAGIVVTWTTPHRASLSPNPIKLVYARGPPYQS